MDTDKTNDTRLRAAACTDSSCKVGKKSVAGMIARGHGKRVTMRTLVAADGGIAVCTPLPAPFRYGSCASYEAQMQNMDKFMGSGSCDGTL